MNILPFLTAIHLFQGLPEKYTKLLGDFFKIKHYKKNAPIFLARQKAANLYIVYSGSVKVYVISNQGKEQIIHIGMPADIIAGFTIFTEEGYPANCSALEDVILLEMSRSQFTKLVSSHPKIALNLLGLQAKRLKELTLKIEGFAIKNTEQKLARYIMKKLDYKNEFKLDLSISALANLFGVTRENLSRTIGKMVKNKIIKFKDKKVEIVNLPKIKTLSGV